MTQLAIWDHNQVAKWIVDPYKLVQVQTKTQLGFQYHNQVAKWTINLYSLIQVKI